MKSKVAIVTPGAFAIPSERNSSVEQAVGHICEQLKDRWQFYVFSKKTGELPAREQRDGIVHYRPNGASYLTQASARLRQIRPNLIQVENRPNMAMLLKKKHPRTPVWLSVHSTHFVSAPQIQGPRLKQCLKAADRIIVNSRFMLEYLKGIVPGIEYKTAVNYPGFDPDRFYPRWTEPGRESREALLHELGYRDKKIILYAGRLIEIKGVHHVLEVLPDIIRDNPNAVFVVIGSARYGKDVLTPYVKHLHQLGNRMPNHVRFIPFVPHNEMGKWFRAADVVVVPSAEQEAFGLVNVEAMACGVPVVATRAGGIPEIIRHRETGFLLDPERLHPELVQAVNRLLKDEGLARRMGELAADHAVKHFTWKHSAERYAQLLGAMGV
jgi:spore coat protein SA